MAKMKTVTEVYRVFCLNKIGGLEYVLVSVYFSGNKNCSITYTCLFRCAGCSLLLGLSPAVMERGLLTAWLLLLQNTDSRHRASVVVAHGLSCPAAWNLPGPGMRPCPPALAGGLLSPVPPGSPPIVLRYSFQTEDATAVE